MALSNFGVPKPQRKKKKPVMSMMGTPSPLEEAQEEAGQKIGKSRA